MTANNSMKVLYVWMLIIAIIISACSSDNIEGSVDINNNDKLQYEVKITSDCLSRAKSDNKTSWQDGDIIYVSIDASKSNLCKLSFEDDKWKVENITNSLSWRDSGTLNAVYADKMEIADAAVTTFGDILYTKSGSYTKQNGVVRINLNMNQRPVAKIKITGIHDGFWIEGLREYTNLDISTMTWKQTSSNGLNCSEKEDENTKTFYGTLPTTSGNTKIKLINNDGLYYEKTFSNKSINMGDYICISSLNGWNTNIYNGHDYVDLGLPSGTKWATMNVGATKPTESGVFVAWGELEGARCIGNYYEWEGKLDFETDNYKYYVSTTDINVVDGFEEIRTYSGYTKYVLDSAYGYKGLVDRKDELDIEDDVAHVTWGGGWRIPTVQQMDELIKYCTWSYGKLDGQDGYKVVGANGNWIFLVSGGYCRGKKNRYIVSGDELIAGNVGGGPYYVPSKFPGSCYWSRNLYETSAPYFLSGNSIGMMSGDRYWGMNIRPVCF